MCLPRCWSRDLRSWGVRSQNRWVFKFLSCKPHASGVHISLSVGRSKRLLFGWLVVQVCVVDAC